MFETALRKLGQRAFDLDEMELEHLVSTFDSDGNGTVELDEFMTFCLSIPSLPWRAEKARRWSATKTSLHQIPIYWNCVVAVCLFATAFVLDRTVRPPLEQVE